MEYVCVMCGYTVNKIGDIGAQYIGDGLKTLTLLTSLNLSCEYCMYHIVVFCVILIFWMFIDVCWTHRQQHWRYWSTIHWWWSQVTHITYNAEFEWWVMLWCVLVLIECWLNVGCKDVCDVCVMCTTLLCVWFECGCTGTKIGNIGAQCIGDGLKSLTSLTTLNLSSEWCVVWCVLHCCVNCVLDVQITTLETLEHNPLVMVSSHSHLWQHWIWTVNDVWCMRLCIV